MAGLFIASIGSGQIISRGPLQDLPSSARAHDRRVAVDVDHRVVTNSW